jgi:hypothetical protein
MGRDTRGRARILIVALAVATIAAAGVTAALTLREGSDGGGEQAAPAHDTNAFERALDSVDSGGTVRLDAGYYETLSVEERMFSAPVRIVGSPGTTVGQISVEGSRNIRFEGFAIEPRKPQEEAVVSVEDSRNVSFADLRFDGLSESQGARLRIHEDAAAVRVVDSDFTWCQSYCIQPAGTSIEILRSRFHDLIESDAIRGGGSKIVIADNTFDRAVPGEAHANHNDFIQITGGRSWLIARNRFGVREFGAAQIFVNAGRESEKDAVIDDIRIDSNLFTGDMAFAIHIGEDTNRVSIVNNTILSGDTAGIRLPDSIPRRSYRRPLVANNVIAVTREQLCEAAVTVANVFLDGIPCSPTDRVAQLTFDDSGRPTSSADLLVNAADPGLAPARDLLGRLREGPPDIGAVELEG